jgi:hypothetical protein
VALERGACAFWAHEHTASWFINRACAMAARDHGWKLFVAYSDTEAGEIGTVYQACGWHYIGRASNRVAHGKPRNKHRYVHFEASRGERKQLLTLLRENSPTLPYPKRGAPPAKAAGVWHGFQAKSLHIRDRGTRGVYTSEMRESFARNHPHLAAQVRRREGRRCAACGCTFFPGRSDAKTCGPRCRMRIMRRRKNPKARLVIRVAELSKTFTNDD